jgi:hypothetical protein
MAATKTSKKPINSRAKGARAERELKNMLKESFPEYVDDFRRNQDQSERGGHDILGLPGFAIECKSVAEFSLPRFWTQTVDQAGRVQLLPALFRKVPLRGWEVYVHLRDLDPTRFGDTSVDDSEYVCKVSYAAFVQFARRVNSDVKIAA